MQTAWLMLIPSYQYNMAEPSCKHRCQRYVFVSDGTKEMIMINGLFLESRVMILFMISGETRGQSHTLEVGGIETQISPLKIWATGRITIDH